MEKSLEIKKGIGTAQTNPFTRIKKKTFRFAFPKIQ